jgi:O-antigen/teichoic acid export membrane protein
MLRRLLSSGSLRGAATFALGGAGFALGNVLLAAALTPTQFGLLSLIMALMQFGLSCGPLGLDVVVKRHRPRVTAVLLRGATLNAALVALLIAAVAGAFYHLEATAVLLLFAGGLLAAGNNIVAGIYQSRGEMGWAMGLAQGPNYVLLLLAVVALLVSPRSATPVLVGVVAGYLLTNLLGWTHARKNQAGCTELESRQAFREAMASVSIGLALQLLWQLERVAIPKLTSVDDLATYAALAAVVGAPFRATQIGVAFTLIHKLRSAPDAATARAVLRHEIMVALLLVAVAIAGVVIIAPLVFHHFLHDKYVISRSLMVVTLAVGIVRVAESFSTTAVTALGTAPALARVSAMGWLGLAVAITGAIVFSAHGLVGIVFGTLLGWLTLWTGGLVIGIRAFRQRFAPSAVGLSRALPQD